MHASSHTWELREYQVFNASRRADRRNLIGDFLGSHKTGSVQQVVQVDVRKPFGTTQLIAPQWKRPEAPAVLCDTVRVLGIWWLSRILPCDLQKLT